MPPREQHPQPITPEVLGDLGAAELTQALSYIDGAYAKVDDAFRFRMIEAFINTGSQQAVFPDIPLSDATHTFFGIAMMAEIQTGQRIIEQRRLSHDHQALAASLTDKLSGEQRAFFDERLDAVRRTKRAPFVDILLRRFNGEPKMSIHQDYAHEVGLNSLSSRFKQAHGDWCGYATIIPRVEALEEQLSPKFPPPRRSFMKDLEQYVVRIDDALAELAARHEPADYTTIMRSLIESNLIAREMATVLNRLAGRSVFGKESGFDPTLSGFILKRYKALQPHILEKFAPKYERQPLLAKPAIFEYSEEASRLIESQPLLQLWRSGNGWAPLSKEETAQEMKIIEAGLYAAQLLLQRTGIKMTVQLPEHPAKDKDLRLLVEEARAATCKILAANSGFVGLRALREKRNLKSNLPLEDLAAAGFRGLLRGIGMFDYQNEAKASLLSYCAKNVSSFIVREIFRVDWKVSATVGERVMMLHACSAKLYGQLGHEPTAEELADDLEWSREQVHKTLQSIAAIKAGNIPQEHKPNSASHNKPRARRNSIEFSTEVAVALEQVFADTPERLAILKMYFGEQATVDEIGEDLQLTAKEVADHLAGITQALSTNFSPSELRHLLKRD